jgi:hypothetical protein
MLADHAIKTELLRLEVENEWKERINKVERLRVAEQEEMDSKLQEVECFSHPISVFVSVRTLSYKVRGHSGELQELLVL